MLEADIASLKRATIVLLTGTPVAPFHGVAELTTGAVTSTGATAPATTALSSSESAAGGVVIRRGQVELRLCGRRIGNVQRTDEVTWREAGHGDTGAQAQVAGDDGRAGVGDRRSSQHCKPSRGAEIRCRHHVHLHGAQSVLPGS